MSEPTALKDWNTIQDYLKSAWADRDFIDSLESQYLIKLKAPTPICKFDKTLRENQGVVPEPEVQPLKTAIPRVIPPIYETIKSPSVKLETPIDVPFFAFINSGWKNMLYCSQAITPYGSASDAILELARCLFLTLERHFIKTENSGKNLEELTSSEKEAIKYRRKGKFFYELLKSQDIFKRFARNTAYDDPETTAVNPGTLSRFISKVYYEYLLALSSETLVTALADQGPKAIFDHRNFETNQIEYQGPELPDVLQQATYPMLVHALELLAFSPALVESMEHRSSAEKLRYPFIEGFTDSEYTPKLISNIIGVSKEPCSINSVINTDFIYQSDSSVNVKTFYSINCTGPNSNLIPVLLSKLVSHTDEDVETEYSVNCKMIKSHKLNEVLNRRLFPTNFEELVLIPNYESMKEIYGHQTIYKDMITGVSSGHYYSHIGGGWKLASSRSNRSNPWESQDIESFPEITPMEPQSLSFGACIPGVKNHQEVFSNINGHSNPYFFNSSLDLEQFEVGDFPKYTGSMDPARLNAYNIRYRHKYVSPSTELNIKPAYKQVANTLPIGRISRVKKTESADPDSTPLSYRSKYHILDGVNTLDKRLRSNSLENKSVLISDEFQKKNNALAIYENGQWYYFRVSPERKDSIRPGLNNPKFIKLFKRPEIFRDGYITIRNKTYAVSRKDLFRGLVQCSKRVGTAADQYGVSPEDREHIDQESNLVQQQQESEIQNSQDS